MLFSEILISDGLKNLVEVMEQIIDIKEILKIFEDKLIEKVKNIYLYYKKIFGEEILRVLKLEDKQKFEIIVHGYI